MSESTYLETIMIRNYLRIAFRNLVRQPSYSLLNVFGLAIGMASSVLIFAFIRVDLTWDTFHHNANRIARVVELQDFGGNELTDVAWTMGPLGPMLVRELPEVEMTTRYYTESDILFGRGDVRRYVKSVAYVDSVFFAMFDFAFVAGNPATALNRPDALIMTESLAKSFFNGIPTLPQTVLVGNQPFVLTAVLKDLPANTHFQFKALISFESKKDDEELYSSWGNNNLSTYLMLTHPMDVSGLGEKITEAYHNKYGGWEGLKFYVQPLLEMHLHSDHIEFDRNWGKSDLNSLYTLGSIAILILLIASINFVNLATARSIRRSREVGLRKVVGANRLSLMIQFLGESLLISFIAMILAGIVAQLFKPVFANLTGRALPLHLLNGGFGTLVLIALAAVTGLLAGLYPAFVLASYRPASVLKSGAGGRAPGGVLLRRGLVTLQFAVTVILLIATAVVYRQVNYMRNKPLGYDKEQVLSIPLHGHIEREQKLALRDRFLQIPGVESATISSGTPTRGAGQSGMLFEGQTDSKMTEQLICDPEYADVFKLTIVQGRFFSSEYPSDLADYDKGTGAVVVNEAAVREAGWTDPIGKTVKMWGMSMPVVGVVKDYHLRGPQREIVPIVSICSDYRGRLMSLRLHPGSIPQTLASLEKVWDQYVPEYPFDYSFVDEQFEANFRLYVRQAQVLETFAGISIFVALLGLVGLVSYATERRSREIGVRKVLGATESQILGLMSREFLLLILLSNLIAWPVAGYLMNGWLQEFPYRTNLGFWLFPSAALVVLFVAWTTLILVSWRASRLNPADVLRYE